MSTDGTTDINESKYSFANKAKITCYYYDNANVLFNSTKCQNKREKKIVIKFDHYVNWNLWRMI